ncbi:hypothetical protein I3U41_17190 [Mycobacteroides abscessus subsp. abscessus]|uniref:hypothetical protein n=1 Tax=Mycobacteroides abscessus TaxID=36809 RepID=UPI0019D12B2F|nr:hypothetical protein [Mycobacteroides abscessus]QSN19643.1 hypothetical protein I3U41_17190 [Mycobacteroides abscessus subsp. abscessus]
MGITYTPAHAAIIKYETNFGTTACTAVASLDRYDEWMVTLGEHNFVLNGTRPKAEEILRAYGELYDRAYPVIREPRVLEGLESEEARDGTVWADADRHTPWRYRFNGVWEYTWVDKHSRSDWGPLTEMGLLTSAGPYTEVIE